MRRFIGAVSSTILDYRKKVRFYKKFLFAGTLWILALPIFYLISLTIGIHNQKKTMYAPAREPHNP